MWYILYLLLCFQYWKWIFFLISWEYVLDIILYISKIPMHIAFSILCAGMADIVYIVNDFVLKSILIGNFEFMFSKVWSICILVYVILDLIFYKFQSFYKIFWPLLAHLMETLKIVREKKPGPMSYAACTWTYIITSSKIKVCKHILHFHMIN